MTNLANKHVSVNDVKNAKAVQVVSNVQALRLLCEMKQHMQSAGGLKSVMELTKNFAYTLSESKVNANDIAGTLQSLYIVDDNNLDGRSLIAQLSISASISAYEAILEELKSNTQETHL